MIAIALRIIAGLVIVYLAVGFLLFAMQSRLIYPASQEVFAPDLGLQPVTLETSDGLELNAHWRPADEGQPTIVWFHGNGGTLRGATAETIIVRDAGYGALLVSYRGYGGNPGTPGEEGFYRDGRAAMAFLEKQGVSLDQTVLIGNSIGSGTATQMAREFDPAALILIAPFTSLPDVANDALPMYPAQWLMRDRFDNQEKLAKLSLPTLVLHGQADQVVPFAHGKTLGEFDHVAFQAFDAFGHELSFTRAAQEAQLGWLRSQGL